MIERIPDFPEIDLNEVLINLKSEIDDLLLKRYDIMDNESFFKKEITPITVEELENHNRVEIIDEVEFFTELIVETYLLERRLNSCE